MAIDSIISLSLVWFEEAGLIFFAFFNDHTLGVVVAVAFGLILLRVLWWWLFHPRLPWLFKAKVQHVCDGDSIWVKTWYGRRVKLRLAGIDAPESEQSYGEVSQRVLEDFIDSPRGNLRLQAREKSRLPPFGVRLKTSFSS